MRKTAVAAIGLLFNSVGIERALGTDIPSPECQETKLAGQLIKQQPIFPIGVDFAQFSQQLQILRVRAQPAPVYMGVSQPIVRGKIIIRTAGASPRRVRKAKNGLVIRCGDSILYATSVGLPTDGSYSLAIAAKAPNIATVSLVDSSMKVTPARFVPFPECGSFTSSRQHHISVLPVQQS